MDLWYSIEIYVCYKLQRRAQNPEKSENWSDKPDQHSSTLNFQSKSPERIIVFCRWPTQCHFWTLLSSSSSSCCNSLNFLWNSFKIFKWYFKHVYLIPAQLWCLILSFQKCDFWLAGLKYLLSTWIDRVYEKFWNSVSTLKGLFCFYLKFCGVSGEQMEQAALCWYCLHLGCTAIKRKNRCE